SSRRRHTRSKRDWSSDVCSSDLHIADHGPLDYRLGVFGESFVVAGQTPGPHQPGVGRLDDPPPVESLETRGVVAALDDLHQNPEIGRASCRERAWIWAGEAQMEQ